MLVQRIGALQEGLCSSTNIVGAQLDPRVRGNKSVPLRLWCVLMLTILNYLVNHCIVAVQDVRTQRVLTLPRPACLVQASQAVST